MNKNRLNKLIASIRTIRTSATDKQALDASGIYPAWDVGIDYEAGDRVLYLSVLYRCLQPHTSQEGWNPIDASSLWANVLIPDPEVIPDWEQPSSTNPYMKGDKVRHNGAVWVSDLDDNVWEPGVYGWTQMLQ